MILAEPRTPGSADPRARLGRLGEAAAESTLRRAGFTVLERRYRLRTGELDLIAEHDGVVVFVEVKTRRGSGYGRPAEAVTPAQQRRLARAALGYLQRKGWLDRPCRFDVVEVFAAGSAVARVRHIEDAFRP